MWVGQLVKKWLTGNDITMGSAHRIYFRDSGISIYSNADGKLTITSDGTGTDDINITGAITGTGNQAITGNVAITGALTVNGVAVDSTSSVGTMSASTVMAATLTTYNVTTFRTGNVIKTTMYIDLTGAASVDTVNNIIGDTGACHIGQVTAAVNGTIFAGQVSCAEVPTTGDDDIDLASSSVATGAYNADVTGLADAQALMTAGGALAIGTVKPFTVMPADNYYLYLASGNGDTAGTYDAGIIIIEMWGLAS